MTLAPGDQSTAAQHTYTFPNLLAFSLWMGLATGLLEAVLFLLLQHAGLVSWVTLITPVDRNILWASPLVDTALFLLAGLVLVPIVCLFPPGLRPTLISFALGAISFYALLSIPGRLKEIGSAMLALGLASVFVRWIRRNPEVRLRIFRRTLPGLVALALATGLGTLAADALREKIEQAELPPAHAGAPNILLIVLDTLRADHMSLYGYSRPTTPFLETYARGAARFESAFAPAPWTVASHASMFTGLYPYQHGGERYGLQRPTATLATVLAAHGYATAAVVANGQVCTRAFGLDQGFQHWDNLFTHPLDVFLRSSLGRKFEKYLLPHLQFGRPVNYMRGDEVNEHALHWLAGRPNRPFFLFLNYMEVHIRRVPPPEYARRFSAEPGMISHAQWVSVRGNEPQPIEPRLSRLNNEAYDSSLAYLDDILKNLFEELARRGLDQNLLVIITSDHGESLGDRGLYGHFSSLYLDQIQVPLIVRYPGKVPAGSVITAPVGITSIPETVMDLAGLEPQRFPGSSLARYWSNAPPEDTEWLSEVASNKGFPGATSKDPNAQGWVKSFENSDWHFILQETGKTELYRWKTDPEETHNEVEDPAVHDLVARFRSRLEQIAASARHWK